LEYVQIYVILNEAKQNEESTKKDSSLHFISFRM